MFQSNFLVSRYQDAPDLSDQLLLPNIAAGHNLFLVAAFVPSYVVKLVADLAASPEIEPGHLSLTFYVPGNMVKEDRAILRLRDYLEVGIGSKVSAAEFVDDCLQLISEGGLSLQVIHGPQKKPIARGAFGVFTDPDTEDFVSIEDSKGGDYNSPVIPMRSWVPEQYVAAEKTLERTNKVISGTKPGALLANHEVAGRWFSKIGLWYGDNPAYFNEKTPVEPGIATREQGDAAGLAIDEIGENTDIDDFLQYLQSDDEFGVAGWYDSPGEFDIDDVSQFFAEGYSVEVDEREIMGYHVPPLPEALVGVIGPASATCPCGRKILRSAGCDSIVW